MTFEGFRGIYWSYFFESLLATFSMFVVIISRIFGHILGDTNSSNSQNTCGKIQAKNLKKIQDVLEHIIAEFHLRAFNNYKMLGPSSRPRRDLHTLQSSTLRTGCLFAEPGVFGLIFLLHAEHMTLLRSHDT